MFRKWWRLRWGVETLALGRVVAAFRAGRGASAGVSFSRSTVVPAKTGTSRHCFVVRKWVRATIYCGEKPGVARRQPSFFASPKKEGKERRPQVRRPCGLPCAARKRGPLRNSGSNAQHGFVAFCARPQTVLADYSGRSCAFGNPLHRIPARQALMSAGTSAKPLPPLRLSWGPRVAARLPQSKGNVVPDLVRDPS